MHKYELFHAPWLLPQPYPQYNEHKFEDISKKVLGRDHGTTTAEAIQLRMPQQGNSHDHGNFGATDGMADEEDKRNELHINCETNKGTKEFCIQIKSEDCDAAGYWRTSHEKVKLGSTYNTLDIITTRETQDSCDIKSSNKRVTIHAYPHNAAGSLAQNGKLINLPGSLEEIFAIGSKQKFQDFNYDLVMEYI